MEPNPGDDVATGLIVDRGLSYDPDVPHRLLDLYHLPDRQCDRRRPAIVVLHGGGFFKGSRADGIPVQTARMLAEAGFVALTPDYLLARDANNTKPAFPGNIHDCRAAVRWVQANADAYGIDADRIGAIGSSAGGWLALCLGLTSGDAYFDSPGQGSPVVQAVVNMYAPTDGEWQANHYGYADKEDMPWVRKHSPVNWVRPSAPPVLTLHGTDDTTVLPENARLLDRAFHRAGGRHELVFVRGAGHTFLLRDESHDLRPQVIDFFRRTLVPVESQRETDAHEDSMAPSMKRSRSL